MIKQVLRNINGLLRKKEKGETSIVITVIAFFIIFPVGIALLLLQSTVTAQQKVQDDLVYSVLAGALVDIYEYGENHNIIIDNPQESYNRYTTCLKRNLNLDSNFNPSENDLIISGQVIPDTFIIYDIYNKDGETVYEEINVLTGTHNSGTFHNNLTAPNGTPVTETSIYAKITFPYKTYFGIEIPASVKDLIAIRAE